MSVHLGASAAESCVNACSEFISELRGLFASSRYSGHSQNDDSFDTARQLGAVYALFAEEDLRTLLSGFVDQAKAMSRSEEQTSELQSRFDLVCRLLLE